MGLRLDLGKERRVAAELAATASKDSHSAAEQHAAEVSELRRQLNLSDSQGRSLRWNLRDMQAHAKAAEEAVSHTKAALSDGTRNIGGDTVTEAKLRDLIGVLRVAESDFRELQAHSGERSVRTATF